jgi:ABC-type branched-subunit amino acid transport system substrate-binding protein
VSFSEPGIAFRERIGSGFGVELLRAHHAYDAFILAALALHRAGSFDGIAVRDALREVAGPPGVQVGAGQFAEALQLIAAGEEIDHQGASGTVDFDARGDVPGLVEIWTFQGGRPVPKKLYDGD